MISEFKLTIELVPSTIWFSSVNHILEKNNQLGKWREIKKELFEREGKKCWICNREGGRLEAHEFWEYDDENHIQKLVAIHHLCSTCHKIKHIGFWDSTEDLVNHFCKVNSCSRKEFEKHEEESFKIWRERSLHHWIQDFGDYTPIVGEFIEKKWLSLEWAKKALEAEEAKRVEIGGNVDRFKLRLVWNNFLERKIETATMLHLIPMPFKVRVNAGGEGLHIVSDIEVDYNSLLYKWFDDPLRLKDNKARQAAGLSHNFLWVMENGKEAGQWSTIKNGEDLEGWIEEWLYKT
jgi:hypothetical protein